MSIINFLWTDMLNKPHFECFGSFLPKQLMAIRTFYAFLTMFNHRHLSYIDCLSFVMCPLLAPSELASFFAAAINSTNEANKAGGTHRYAVYIT